MDNINSVVPAHDAVADNTYNTVRDFIIIAQKQLYAAVNFAMVNAYWNIGKKIYESCGENDRAAYGKQLLQFAKLKK